MATKHIDIEGLDDVKRKLQQLDFANNKKAQRKLHNLISYSLRRGVKAARRAAQGMTGNDPRKTFLGIRSLTWRGGTRGGSDTFGGNISMLARMRAARKPDPASSYRPPRTLREGQRGGNRMKRSASTERMDSYSGLDRQMIFMWNSNGAKRPGGGSRRYSDSGLARPARRGNIAPRGWFTRVAPIGLAEAEAYFGKRWPEVVDQLWNDSFGGDLDV